MLIFLSPSCYLVLWYCGMNLINSKGNQLNSNGEFYCAFQHRAALRGNQHEGHEYDALQNWLNMTSNDTFYNV